MADLKPDIHELFCYYNSIYFSDLCACIVSWAPCLTSIAACCDCIEEGLCEIQLSVPLLKHRSSADLKNILLHEMIHAYLWIKHKINNHSDHGSKFMTLANIINSNCREDDQRPSNGYYITAHHDFLNEVNTKNPNTWRCLSCRDSITKGTNEEPSPDDCIEKNGDDNCGKPLCRWHRHKNRCPGRYEKVDDVSKFVNKGKSIGASPENEGDKHTNSSQLNRQARQKLPPAEEIKDKRIIKKPKIMADYLSLDYKPKKSGKRQSQPDGPKNTNQLIPVDLKTQSLVDSPEIPRQRRTSCRKSPNHSNTEGNMNKKRGREITLVIQMFGVFTDEESEEDPEPLINKRSERRKRMKLLNNSHGRGEHTACEVISLD